MPGPSEKMRQLRKHCRYCGARLKRVHSNGPCAAGWRKAGVVVICPRCDRGHSDLTLSE